MIPNPWARLLDAWRVRDACSELPAGDPLRAAADARWDAAWDHLTVTLEALNRGMRVVPSGRCDHQICRDEDGHTDGCRYDDGAD